MAFDRIEPPDLWEVTSARLLYRLVCAWSSGKVPPFADFVPGASGRGSGLIDEREVLAAFGALPRARP